MSIIIIIILIPGRLSISRFTEWKLVRAISHVYHTALCSQECMPTPSLESGLRMETRSLCKPDARVELQLLRTTADARLGKLSSVKESRNNIFHWAILSS